MGVLPHTRGVSFSSLRPAYWHIEPFFFGVTMQPFMCDTVFFKSTAACFDHIERAALLRYFSRLNAGDAREQHAGETGDNSNARPIGVSTMSAIDAADAAHHKRHARPVTAQELAAAADPDAQIRIAVVCALTGLGVTSIRDRVKAGTFPAPIHFTQRLVRWRAGDVREWIRANRDPFAPH